MPHASFYRDNTAYAAFLQNQAPTFFDKYATTLQPRNPGARVLDVGCGVGQVVGRLRHLGFAAQGVDLCVPAVELAKARGLPCEIYDGRALPFADHSFAATGAFNVLEHVDDAVALLREMARVTQPGGRLVVSSPNFFRVIGSRDYHPHMRGLGQKWRNALRLREKLQQIRRAPNAVRFDAIAPISRTPLQPDDDAITATNPLEIAFHLRRAGCRLVRVDCTDRPVPPPLEFLLNATPLKWIMLNGFVVAEKL
jgi:SAM-dependent methyltransferase